MFFDVGEVQKQTGFSPVLSLQRLSRDCYRGWVATAQPALRATALPLLEAALSFPGGSHSYPLYHHDALTEYLKSYFFHFCFLPRWVDKFCKLDSNQNYKPDEIWHFVKIFQQL